MASCAFTVIFSNRNIKTVNPWYRSKKGLACRPAPIFTAYILPRQPFSLPPLLPDGSGHGRSSHVDLNLLWLGFLALRDTQRQHAVLKIGFDGIWIHGIRKRKTAGEGAVGALHAKVILFVHLLFKLALAPNGEDVVLHADVQIFRIDFREIRLHHEFVFRLVDVNRRRPGTEAGLFGGPLKGFLEQAIDLVLQGGDAAKRLPSAYSSQGCKHLHR